MSDAYLSIVTRQRSLKVSLCFQNSPFRCPICSCVRCKQKSPRNRLRVFTLDVVACQTPSWWISGPNPCISQQVWQPARSIHSRPVPICRKAFSGKNHCTYRAVRKHFQCGTILLESLDCIRPAYLHFLYGSLQTPSGSKIELIRYI